MLVWMLVSGHNSKVRSELAQKYFKKIHAQREWSNIVHTEVGVDVGVLVGVDVGVYRRESQKGNQNM